MNNCSPIRDPLVYADCFKIPRSISKPLLRDVNLWVKCNGTEWCVDRLKAVKLDFIRLKAGLDPVSTWIARRDSHHFSGYFGALQRWSRKDWKRWSRAIQLLQVYTMFISPNITPNQERKFLDGVTAKNVEIPVPIVQGVKTAVYKLGLFRSILQSPKPLAFRNFSDARSEPHPNGKSYPEGKFSLECAASYIGSTLCGWNLYDDYPEIFDSVMLGVVVKDPHREHGIGYVEYPDSVGKIGIIQEPGFKLRAVANPGRVYQQALSPLGDVLYDILKVLPWDCTHDQNRADDYIIRSLRSNTNIFCVDLSGATDYFPLDLQMEVLKTIFGASCPYIHLFFELSRLPWKYGDKTIKWTKGQPLGLYPSFASFALTHGLLLYALNGFSHLGKFFVLGDDVVILDEKLYRSYRAVLTALECPVSEAKTLVSSSLAEFSGKIYSSDGKLSQLKWRSVSDDSFLDIVRNIGPSAFRLLRPRQRKIARLLSEVPSFCGGLGFNPKGIPLEDRYFKTLCLFDKMKNVSYLMSYNKKLMNLIYYDSSHFSRHREVTLSVSDADQASVALVQEYLPSLINWYEVLGANMYSLSEDFPLDIDAPTGRKSRLEQLEQLLTV